VPEAVITIDNNGLIESFSPAASRLFGYEPDVVVGRNVKLLMPSLDREQRDECGRHYRETGVRRTIGIGGIAVGLRADGSTFAVEVTVRADQAGGRQLITTFVCDLPERDGTERRLQQLQAELLQVSRLGAMGQMSSAIAHELNQPLTAILNYVKATRRTLESDNPSLDRIKDMIDKAANQALRASALIRNLREFVEKREGQRAIESLNKVVDEAVALALVDAADSRVNVRLELDPALPPVRMDRLQIQQVLINLIRNAVEAMLEVKTRSLSVVTGATATGFAQVTITDTGPGLPPDVAARLFQPFVTTKKKGMGIGLIICQSIVEAHGGTLWAETDAGSGAVFRFRLPLAATVEDPP